jgi:hypothetical protein
MRAHDGFDRYPCFPIREPGPAQAGAVVGAGEDGEIPAETMHAGGFDTAPSARRRGPWARRRPGHDR